MQAWKRARLLLRHPHARLVAATGRSEAGKPLVEVFPHLWQHDLVVTEAVDVDVDVIISCLPHAASATALAPYLSGGVPVIDVSADFRLHDADEYRDWYGVDHPAKEHLAQAVYGLPELHRDAIPRARSSQTLVAIPPPPFWRSRPRCRRGSSMLASSSTANPVSRVRAAAWAWGTTSPRQTKIFAPTD